MNEMRLLNAHENKVNQIFIQYIQLSQVKCHTGIKNKNNPTEKRFRNIINWYCDHSHKYINKQYKYFSHPHTKMTHKHTLMCDFVWLNPCHFLANIQKIQICYTHTHICNKMQTQATSICLNVTIYTHMKWWLNCANIDACVCVCMCLGIVQFCVRQQI